MPYWSQGFPLLGHTACWLASNDIISCLTSIADLTSDVRIICTKCQQHVTPLQMNWGRGGFQLPLISLPLYHIPWSRPAYQAGRGKESGCHTKPSEGRTIWYMEGGGLEKEGFWKCGQKKKFVVEIDEKYVDQKKHQMITYIIGKAYDKNIYSSSSTKI